MLAFRLSLLSYYIRGAWSDFHGPRSSKVGAIWTELSSEIGTTWAELGRLFYEPGCPGPSCLWAELSVSCSPTITYLADFNRLQTISNRSMIYM